MAAVSVGVDTRPPKLAWGPVGLVIGVQVAVLSALSGRYGFHRDELYFMAAGDRPAWGYVDQPPVIPLLAKVSTAIFGDTPSGLRVVATLMAAATVLLVAVAARELGADTAGQVLAAGATAASGSVLAITHMVSTATADLLIWTAVAVLLLRLLRTRDGRLWLAIGAVVGIGMGTKWLVLLLVASLAVALLAVGPRDVLRGPWLFAGIGVGLVIAAPFVIWQATHGWPQLTVASGISEEDGTENRIMFVPQQLLYLSPVLVPVWLAGLVRLWRNSELRWARSIAVAYPILAVATIALGGKGYYSVPLLLVLLAAGAEPTMQWLRQGRRWVIGVAAGVPGLLVAVVIGLPVLPTSQLGIVMAINKEAGEQVGWPRFAGTVAEAWRLIPPEQRGTAVIFTRNYGQAGAIEQFGPEHGLPKPYSGHMSYADWGPPPDTMTGPVVLVGGTANYPGVQQNLTGCQVVTRIDNGEDVDNEEQDTPIALCSPPASPWSTFWPQVRHFY